MTKIRIIEPPKDSSLLQSAFCYIPVLPPFTMFITMYEEDSLSVAKDLSWDGVKKQIDITKIPDGFPFRRMTWNYGSVGSIIKKPNMLIIGMTVPISLKNEIRNALIVCLRKAIKKQGVDIEFSNHRNESNDYIFLNDGKEKKFTGIAKDTVQNEEALFVCLSPILEFSEEDKNLWRALYRLDSSKILRRGDVVDLFDIVGGLKEANPDIDVGQLEIDFVQLFVDRFDLEIEEDVFSEEELLDIKELDKAINDEAWVEFQEIPSFVTREMVKKLLD